MPQQAYRLPTAGQTGYQQNPPVQPVIRPPVNPGVRQIINSNLPPQVRNIPPSSNQPIRPPIIPNQQQQFRPPPPQQPQQQFQQRPSFPPNQVPLDQKPQYRPPQQAPPVHLQRQQIPEQKIIRHPPPLQNPVTMSEINRERTFTASNEVSVDDDDDVVVGRMVTPQARPSVVSKPVENYEQRPMSGARDVQQPMMQQQPQQQPRPMPPQAAPMMQRRESVQSIPSRPPSGLGSNNSQSPEPRMNPVPQAMPMNVQPPMQQQPYVNRSEMNRQSPSNYDYTREPMEASDRVERVQRPVNQPNNVPQQRQSPEGNMQRQAPKLNQQPVPPQQHYRPPPPQMPPQNDIHMRQNQDPKATHQPNLSASRTQDQMRQAEVSKPAEVQGRKNSVRLDLGKSDNVRSAKDKSPSSKKAILHSST